jgi:hypothetical protein
MQQSSREWRELPRIFEEIKPISPAGLHVPL